MLTELDRHLRTFAFDVPVDVRVGSSYSQLSRYLGPDGKTIVGDFSAMHGVVLFPLGDRPIHLVQIPTTYTAPLSDIYLMTGESLPAPRAFLEIHQLQIGENIARRLISEVPPTVNGCSLDELTERIEGLQALLGSL